MADNHRALAAKMTDQVPDVADQRLDRIVVHPARSGSVSP